jgi:predicted lipid-binding transport protein (Tim44 family)
MAGGVAGGFLGSMLFNSVGRAMGGGYGAYPSAGGVAGGYNGTGGGFGLFELLVIAGLGYLGYRMFRSRQGAPLATSSSGSGSGQVISFRMPPVEAENSNSSATNPIDSDTASDIFFRVQGAWTRRDLESIKDLLGESVQAELQRDLDQLRRERQINRLENISVRQVEMGETWRDGDSDVATVRFYANLLDYTVDETTHRVLAGSDSVPVKFIEDWTFARSGGSTAWQVVGISQVQ